MAGVTTDWAKPADPLVHTFSTGNQARLRLVQFRVLFREGKLSQEQWDVFLGVLMDPDGVPDDPVMARDVEDLIVCSSWVEPRVAVPDADGNVLDGFVSIALLADAEIVETVQYAIQALVTAGAATFRSLALGAEGGADGARVGNAAESAAGPRGRVKGGSAGRRAAGRAAPGA